MVGASEGRTERRGGVKIHHTNLDSQDLIAVQSSQRGETRRPLEDRTRNTAGDHTHGSSALNMSSAAPGGPVAKLATLTFPGGLDVGWKFYYVSSSSLVSGGGDGSAGEAGTPGERRRVSPPAPTFIPRQADVAGSTRSVRWTVVLEGSNIRRVPSETPLIKDGGF